MKHNTNLMITTAVGTLAVLAPAGHIATVQAQLNVMPSAN